MDLKKAKQSANFEDRTGWTPEQRRIQTVLALLNPAAAAASTFDWMQAHGYAPIHSEVDFRTKR